MIRFIAFVLGVSCATTFNPRCVPYAVISSLALVPSLLTLIVEWLHFHLLWNYQPDVDNSLTKRRDRFHLRFILYKLINEKRKRGCRVSLCENDEQCRSNSLNHTILYHSMKTARVENNQTIIAYHVTTTALAIEITQNGFPVNYIRQMQSDIYFTRTVETFNNANVTDPEAIISVRLRPGYTLRVENDDRLEFGRYNTLPILPQTLECVTFGKIKV
jgi:hypothetical protein